MRRFLIWLFSSECEHDWTLWEEYGFTFQRRRCKKCGKYQDADTLTTQKETK